MYRRDAERARSLTQTLEPHAQTLEQIEELERRDAERACYVDTLRADHLQEVQFSYLN
jgi:hypothetical protein